MLESGKLTANASKTTTIITTANSNVLVIQKKYGQNKIMNTKEKEEEKKKFIHITSTYVHISCICCMILFMVEVFNNVIVITINKTKQNLLTNKQTNIHTNPNKYKFT